MGPVVTPPESKDRGINSAGIKKLNENVIIYDIINSLYKLILNIILRTDKTKNIPTPTATVTIKVRLGI
jgi:hypothetical protein